MERVIQESLASHQKQTRKRKQGDVLPPVPHVPHVPYVPRGSPVPQQVRQVRPATETEDEMLHRGIQQSLLAIEEAQQAQQAQRAQRAQQAEEEKKRQSQIASSRPGLRRAPVGAYDNMVLESIQQENARQKQRREDELHIQHIMAESARQEEERQKLEASYLAQQEARAEQSQGLSREELREKRLKRFHR
jgi:hypothetical protein